MHAFDSPFKKRITFAVIATLVASSTVSIAAGAAYATTTATTATAERSYTAAIGRATDTDVNGRTDYAAVSDELVRAQAALRSAVGSPAATQNASAALSGAVGFDRLLLNKANSELNELSKSTSAAGRFSHSSANGVAATSRVSHAPTAAIDALHTETARLLTLEAQLSAAIVAATAPVAVAPVVAAPAPAPAARPAPVAHAAPAPATLNVWTSGFQNELNACRGAVDLTAAYGVATIGEKWGCGGSQFPAAGSVITLTGLRAGTYTVGPVAAVLNAYTQNPSDIPRGFALLYQTCRNNDAHTEIFVELTPVS